MEIRPELLERILAESDEKLWETVRRIAEMNNITLPIAQPSHANMESLRAILRSGALGYDDALRILSSHKGEKP